MMSEGSRGGRRRCLFELAVDPSVEGTRLSLADGCAGRMRTGDAFDDLMTFLLSLSRVERLKARRKRSHPSYSTHTPSCLDPRRCGWSQSLVPYPALCQLSYDGQVEPFQSAIGVRVRSEPVCQSQPTASAFDFSRTKQRRKAEHTP